MRGYFPFRSCVASNNGIPVNTMKTCVGTNAAWFNCTTNTPVQAPSEGSEYYLFVLFLIFGVTLIVAAGACVFAVIRRKKRNYAKL